MSNKVGIGYDVHKLVHGRKLVLGGLEIPYEKGLLGHSDADVLVHAIIDSLLGALGKGDIGTHFPDSNIKYKDVSSLKLLRKVRTLLEEEKCEIINIDTVIIAQKPKLLTYIKVMKKNISETLNIDENKINIKATTEEGLGFTGREEGIAAKAICSVNQ